MHVLVCQQHRETAENLAVLEAYKLRCIMKQQTDIPSFSREISISMYVTGFSNNQLQPAQPIGPPPPPNTLKDVQEDAIFMLQIIVVDEQEYSVFYDSGCGQFVVRHKAVQRLGWRAQSLVPGPKPIYGLANSKTISEHGVYQVTLPLFNGENATLSGLCLNEITQKFPSYPLQGEIEDDIHRAYNLTEKPRELPKLPRSVGGSETDFMIGIKYKRYQPKEIFELPSGLTILESKFLNPDGSRGVICGPHALVAGIEAANHSLTAFLSNQFKLYRNGYMVNPDVSMLPFRPDNCIGDTLMEVACNDCMSVSYVSRKLEFFQSVEDAGSEILYRCEECRKCETCKQPTNIEDISIKQAAEQQLVNKSVTINVKEQRIEATLPMIHEPSTKLPPSNRNTALQVYNRVVKQLDKSPQDKEDIIKSEASMQENGFVDFLSNLSEEDRAMLDNSPVKYYIPWRPVFKASASTPCRMVFDASYPTSTGFSLNDILPKGINSLNKLAVILIRWFIHPIAFHTDIRKMFNTLHLNKQFWTFQRYIWHPELDLTRTPVEKFVKTVIFGLRPSGNQAEYALRQLAKLSKEKFPDVHRIIHDDTYMDDCISGGSSIQETNDYVDRLETVINQGNFTLKGVARSGEPPPANLSLDGTSVSVAGMNWFTQDDVISLCVNELNFAKKTRGKKSTSTKGVVPTKLTRKNCASRTGEIYDISGKVAPLVGMFKVDLHELSSIHNLKWADAIPDSLRNVWLSHFEMMEEIDKLRFKRAVIPTDAVSPSFQTLDFGDASTKLACVAIYARFLRKNGEYSCQLLFARTKIISPPQSQPRNELLAATVSTHTGEVVKRACGEYFQKHIKVTDSQVTLFWIHNDNKPLKQHVRNRVLEIRRFTLPEEWCYTTSANMIADIGTCPVQDISVVDQDSSWINGYSWMTDSEEQLPFQSIEEIKLTNEEMEEVKKESLCTDWVTERYQPNAYSDEYSTEAFCVVASRMDQAFTSISDEVKSCYQFSSYIVDPNRHRYEHVVRIVALVLRFYKNIKLSLTKKLTLDTEHWSAFSRGEPYIIPETDLASARNYYFIKATAELKQFAKPADYEKISIEKDNILYYTGRILPTENIIDVREQMSDVMKDLSATTFCVPLVYRHSPLAYSIVNDIHWYSKVAQHSGIESVWRYVMKVAYIVGGRSLVKKFKVNCIRCRYLRKKFIDVEMGPVSSQNLTIAPAFYSTQVDITGPFLAYDPTNKRKKTKVWFVVYCCSTTATISVKVMEDYSTTSFILAFIRFTSDVGYPKTLQVDEGSQLVKGCNAMKLSFVDVKNRLHREMSVDYNVCPVGGHNVNGKVERRIRHLKESMEKVMSNERLSIIQWETMVAQILNSINDLPLALGNLVADFENADLLTPNRLKLGRNNDRAPVFPIETDDLGNLQRIIEENDRIYSSWFEVWLVSHVPKLMEQPKWYNTERDMQICDIVLMLKQEGVLNNTYQYGMVQELQHDKDGIIRQVKVKYRNSNENTDRFTWRSVRKLVIIHPVDELSIMEELAQSSNYCSCHCS